MGLPVYKLNRSEWRTLLQPIVVVSEGVLEDEDAVETVDVDVVAAVDADVEVAVARKIRSGCPSQSSAVWSRTERSSLLRRSTSSLYPSKSSRSSITSLVPPSRMRF